MRAVLVALLAALALPASAAADSGYSQSVLSDPNLVSFWRLGENYGDPDNTPGLPMVDATGRHNGVFNGALTTGVPGPLEGDPTTATVMGQWAGYGSVPYTAALNPGAFTIEAWANPKANQEWMTVISTMERAGQLTGYNLGTGDDWGNAAWVLSIGSAAIRGPDIVPGKWVYLVGTYDGSVSRFYVNGLPVGAATVAPFVPNTSWATTIGLQAGPGGFNIFNGTLADVALYNTALPAATIMAHYSEAINNGVSPDIQITAGPSGITASRTASVTFASSSVDPTFQCQLDGGQWYGCTSPTPVSVGDGFHHLGVRAVNRAGSVSATPAVAEWTVDSAAPQAKITSAPPPVTDDRAAAISFSAPGATGYECALDGGTAQPCESPYYASGLLDGSHTLSVKAVSPIGVTQSDWTTVTWTVDTVPPVTFITSGPVSPSDPPVFVFGASKSPVTFVCRLDQTGWRECDSPYRVPNVKAGPHVFTVVATDAAGNRDTSGASYAWIAGNGGASAQSRLPRFRGLAFPRVVVAFATTLRRSHCAARSCLAAVAEKSPALTWRFAGGRRIYAEVISSRGDRVGVLTRRLALGRGRLPFPARLWRRLRPGTYEVSVRATAGRLASPIARLSFRVAP